MRIAQPLITVAAVSLLALSGAADAKTRAECERNHKPQVRQAGKDVICVPTPDELVNEMLTVAKVTPKDYVVDLGATLRGGEIRFAFDHENGETRTLTGTLRGPGNAEITVRGRRG